METKILSVLLALLLLFMGLYSCGNEESVDASRSKNITETAKIEDEKNELTFKVDSLNKNIDSLKKHKELLLDYKSTAELKIFSIIKNSFLDHIIIGSENLSETTELFRKLGFSIKDGKVHKNGIRNNFIEFADNTEIEIVEVKYPTEDFAIEYKNLISQNKFGLQFSLRVDVIENLKNNFSAINSNFVELQKGNDYSTLSAKGINFELPIFFIQFDKLNNSNTNHLNHAKGITSVWFETKDIKKTARELVDFGFDPIGNYYIPNFTGKVVEFKNANFKIVLIESDKYEITGITISVDSKSDLLKIINDNFDKNFLNKVFENRKSIFLPNEITKSIWLEFVE